MLRTSIRPRRRAATAAGRQSPRQARLCARVVRVAQQRWAGEHDDDGEKPLRVVACSSVRQRRTAVNIDVALELQGRAAATPADERPPRSRPSRSARSTRRRPPCSQSSAAARRTAVSALSVQRLAIDTPYAQRAGPHRNRPCARLVSRRRNDPRVDGDRRPDLPRWSTVPGEEASRHAQAPARGPVRPHPEF